MATFGKQASANGPGGAKPAFGKKAAPSPMGRAAPAAREQLSPQALAFLQAERGRPAAAPAASAPNRAAAQPAYATPAGLQAGKPVWGRRVIAALIDGVVFILPLVLVVALMGPQPGMTDAQFGAGYVAGLLFLMLGGLAYSIGMESSSLQATLGKLAVGAIVTDKTGGKPTLGAVVMRNTLGKLVSGFTPFYISYLMGLARKDRRCLHDLIAGTMVCAKGNASVSYENTFA